MKRIIGLENCFRGVRKKETNSRFKKSIQKLTFLWMTSYTRRSYRADLYRPGDGRSVAYYYHSQEIDAVDCVHAVCLLGTRRGVDGVRRPMMSYGNRRSRRPSSRSPHFQADSSSNDRRPMSCSLGLYYLWLRINATVGSSTPTMQSGRGRRPSFDLSSRICLSNYCLTIEVEEVSWWLRCCRAVSLSHCPAD